MIDRGHSGPRQHSTAHGARRTADAPTVDGWTGRQQDSPHRARRAAQRAAGRADALTLAVVAAGHRKAPGRPGGGHRGGRVEGSIVGAVFDQVGRVTAEQPTEFVKLPP